MVLVVEFWSEWLRHFWYLLNSCYSEDYNNCVAVVNIFQAFVVVPSNFRKIVSTV